MSNAVRIDQLEDTMQAHQRYCYRYTVLWFGQLDDGSGLHGTRTAVYAATGAGLESEVEAAFRFDSPNHKVLAVSRE